MSLMASAQMRMKKKRDTKTNVLSPTAKSSPSNNKNIVSPRNNGIASPRKNNFASPFPSGSGKEDILDRTTSASSTAYPFDAAPATPILNGVKNSLQYHDHGVGMDPPMRPPSNEEDGPAINNTNGQQQQQRMSPSSPYDSISPRGGSSPSSLPGMAHSQYSPSDPPPPQASNMLHPSPQQQQQQPHALQQQQQYQRPPPMPNRNRNYGGGGGINSLDNSGEYVVDNHAQNQNRSNSPQWHQNNQNRQRGPSPSPSQHSQHSQHSQRGVSPAPSQHSQHSQRGMSPSPYILHNQNQQRATATPPPPSPVRDLYNHHNAMPIEQSFESVTRYQGNYTHNLLPQRQQNQPRRSASRPRRRYDSFTGAPEGAEPEDEIMGGEQQAFDPFAPSPLTIPQNQMGNLHASHRASPLFDQNSAFGAQAQQQMAAAASASGGYGSMMYSRSSNSDSTAPPPPPNYMPPPGVPGGMPDNMQGGMYDNNTNNGAVVPQMMMQNNQMQNNAHHNMHNTQQDPTMMVAAAPSATAAPGLTTIDGSKLGNFVYDPEIKVNQSQSESFGEDNPEIMNANANANRGAPSNSSSEDVAEDPSSLMNNYDFEYHTEKDEFSTFDNEDVADATATDGAYNTNNTNSTESQNDDEAPHSTSNPDDYQTVNSEMALQGTPAKRKENTKLKKRHKHKSRIIIDNVDDADNHGGNASRRQLSDGSLGPVVEGFDPRIDSDDNMSDEFGPIDEEEDAPLDETVDEIMTPEQQRCQRNQKQYRYPQRQRISSNAQRDIAVQARRIASGSGSGGASGENEDGGEDDDQEGSQPPRLLHPRLPIGSNKRHDNVVGGRSLFDANEESVRSGGSGTRSNTSGGTGNTSRSLKQNVPFDNSNGGNGINASKSWDSQDAPKTKQSESFGSFGRSLVWEDDIDPGNDNGGEQSGEFNAQQQQQQQQLSPIRASKLWDDDVNNNNNNSNNNNVDEDIATVGTWGDNTASLFGGLTNIDTDTIEGNKGGGNAFDSDKENLFSQQSSDTNLFQQQDPEANEKALAEWDRAEAEWRGNISVVDDASATAEEAEDRQLQQGPGPSSGPRLQPLPLLSQTQPPPLLAPPKQKSNQHHPWRSSTGNENPPMDFGEFGPEPSVFSEITKPSVFSPSLFSEDPSPTRRNNNKLNASIDDDDSIFEFGTKTTRESADFPPAAPTTSTQSHKSIFGQINSSLKQAGKTKSRALGVAPNPSDDQTEMTDLFAETERMAQEEELLKKVQDSPGSLKSAQSHTSILSKGSKKKGDKAGKKISFGQKPPMVHTYIAPDEVSTDTEEAEIPYLDDEETYDEVNDVSEIVRINTEENAKTSFDDVNSPTGVSLQEKIAGENDKRQQQVQKQHPSENDSQNASEADTYGESTQGESVTYKSDGETAQSETKNEAQQAGGNGAGGMVDMNFMEHVELGLGAVAASLGGMFAFGATKPSATGNNEKEDQSLVADVNAKNSGGEGENRSIATEEDEGHSIETDLDDDEGTYGESTVQSTLYTGRTEQSEYDWLGYLQGLVFPKDADGGGSIGSQTELNAKYSETYDDGQSTYQEDEDSYLLQQALAAARAIHHVQGVEYDESQEINVLTDIKFVVVTVSLPLGLLFQEHEIGVWVSRVVPSGNGANMGVQHGDQLAAINGNSSVHTTIDEVATTISGTPSNVGVELTFLRYVGPLRPVPGSVIQEGFEVTDTSVSTKKNVENVEKKQKSKRSLFSRGKSQNKMATPPSSPGGLIMSSTRRLAKLDLSPRSPKRQSQSPKHSNNSPSAKASTGQSGASAASSRASSSRQSSLSMPSLPPAGQQSSSTKPSLKKKKSLGKMLSFKKKS